MQLALGIIVFDISNGNVLEFEMKDPGIPLHAFIIYQRPQIAVAGRQEVATPVVLMQVDPDAPKRRRRFVALSTKTVIDSTKLEPPCDEMIYVATCIHPDNGMPIVIYEAPLPSLAQQLAAIGDVEVRP